MYLVTEYARKIYFPPSAYVFVTIILLGGIFWCKPLKPSDCLHSIRPVSPTSICRLFMKDAQELEVNIGQKNCRIGKLGEKLDGNGA